VGGEEMMFDDESESTHPKRITTTSQQQTVDTSKIEKQSKAKKKRKRKKPKRRRKPSAISERSCIPNFFRAKSKSRDSRKYRSTCRASMMTELRDASGASWVHGPVLVSFRFVSLVSSTRSDKKRRKERAQ
jgi:UTP:GlnB (protein PII) uridylyltransferase